MLWAIFLIDIAKQNRGDGTMCDRLYLGLENAILFLGDAKEDADNHLVIAVVLIISLLPAVFLSGTWIYTQFRDGIIQNGGLNPTPLSWDDDTGLNTPSSKGERNAMEYTIKVKRMENTMNGTPQGKAFMAMYHLLDGVYSRFSYKNLAVVLSDTSPYIWADGMPADLASWEEFSEFYQEAKAAYSTEFDAAYYTCIRFLRQYEEEWDYPIPYAMEEFTRDKYWEFYYKQV